MDERRIPTAAEVREQEVAKIAAAMANPVRPTLYLLDGVNPYAPPASPVADGRLGGGDRP
jgi:hypothetical protein